MATIGTDIDEAVSLLKQGELVAIPTETVYGLAANAFDAIAVSKIFEAKNRPFFNPLIVHCHSIEQASQVGEFSNEKAIRLAQKFWPGPLTLIVPRKNTLPDIVTAGHEYVGLRIPDHPLSLQLLRSLPFPLAAPSANPFGYVSPTTAMHVQEQLGDRISYILDGGPCQVGIESTIVSFASAEPVLLRQGGLSQEQLEELTGPILTKTGHSQNPIAPGQLASHYSPSKRLIIGDLDQLVSQYAAKNYAIISFSRPVKGIDADRQFILSPSGDLHEAARNIFSALREMDKQDTELLLAEWMPDEGLGRAINDRLKRASAG